MLLKQKLKKVQVPLQEVQVVEEVLLMVEEEEVFSLVKIIICRI